MFLSYGSGDLCKRYRPRDFSSVIGQESIVKILRKVPTDKNSKHTFLFLGESGVGKTSLARILAMALNCDNLSKENDPCKECDNCTAIMSNSHPAVHEIDATDQSGIGDVRQLRENLNLRPILGKAKVLIVDECHMLSKPAQNGFLKPGEDTPEHVFIIFCSTEEKKIISTLKNRAQILKFKSVPDFQISDMITTVATLENGDINKKVVDVIVESCGGSPRNALNKLQEAISLGLDSPLSKLIPLLTDTEFSESYLNFFRVLMSRDWPDVIKKYKSLSVSDFMIFKLSLSGWFRYSLEKAKTYRSSTKAVKALDISLQDLPPAKPENRIVSILYHINQVYKNE